MDNTKNIRVLSLCTGYGGLELGLSRALDATLDVVSVEVEAYAQAVICKNAAKETQVVTKALCGLILKPSRQQSFEDALILSLRDTPASRSVMPASEKEQTTLDTFGRILQESSRQLSLFGASLRTSRDILPSDSPKFIEAYDLAGLLS